jgi:hypothetical protein
MATTAIAFASGLAMPAEAKKKDPSKAPKVVSSGKKMKLKLYGQITRTAAFVDNGEAVGFANSENGHTSTRMGVRASGKINNDLKLKLRYEWNMRAAHENRQLLNTNGDNDFDIRWADIQFHHKRFGTLFFGRGDGSGNSSSQVDLSGTSTAGLGGTEDGDFQGARFIETNTSAAGVARANVRVDRAFSQQDATSRTSRIRYDTPSIYGFRLSGSIIDQDTYEFALWYKGKIAGWKLRGALNTSHGKSGVFPGDGAGTAGTNTEITLYNGSVSVQSPWGIGVTASGAYKNHAFNGDGTVSLNNAVQDAHNWWVSVWYRAKFFELGETRFRYGFQTSVDNTAQGDIGQVHGFTILQNIKSTGTDMYIGFRHASLDTDRDNGIGGNRDFEDQQAYVLGFRARF